MYAFQEIIRKKNYVEILEEKPGKSAILRVHSQGEDGAVGGLAMRRDAGGNATMGIGWESGEEARWDLDLIGGTNDLNLNNKNISGDLLLNFGNTLRFGVGNGEKPGQPNTALIDLHGLAVGTTARTGIPDHSIGLANGGVISFANKEGAGQSAMITAIDTGQIPHYGTTSLEAFGTQKPYAVILILDDTGYGVGMIVLQGDTQATFEMVDPNERFGTQDGIDGSINIYFNDVTQQYELENRSGSPSAFRIFYFRRT